MAADTVVAPDVTTLRNIANNYLQRAGDLRKLVVTVDMATIAPGSFQMANELKTMWDQRKTEFKGFLNDLADAMELLGRQLLTIADRYATTDDVNKDDAQRVAELIQAFHDKYPGVDGIVPPTTGP
jgi:hypothetical protein